MAATAVRLSDQEARDALRVAERALGKQPKRRLEAIASGQIVDDDFERAVALRDRLREATLIQVAIGRHAFDYLRGLRWDDPAVEAPLQAARVGETRCTLRAAPEALDAMATECERQAQDVGESDKLLARRLHGAAARLAH